MKMTKFCYLEKKGTLAKDIWKKDEHHIEIAKKMDIE